jgi:hypothetical protein
MFEYSEAQQPISTTLYNANTTGNVHTVRTNEGRSRNKCSRGRVLVLHKLCMCV